MGMIRKYPCGCEMVSKTYCPEGQTLWNEIQREWEAAGKPASNSEVYRKLTVRWNEHFTGQAHPVVVFACGRGVASR